MEETIKVGLKDLIGIRWNCSDRECHAVIEIPLTANLRKHDSGARTTAFETCPICLGQISLDEKKDIMALFNLLAESVQKHRGNEFSLVARAPQHRGKM